MPNAIVIPLQRTNDAPLPPAVGECTHGAFFALLRRADPELAARLHANPERKPFTLSRLREEQGQRPRAGQSAELRVTFLDDGLFPLFAGALLHGGLQEGLRIGQAQFLVTGLLTTADTHPRAGRATFDQLIQQAEDAETLRIHFASPTLFRSQGRDVLWPTPRHVWQSWVRAWNAHVDTDAIIDETALVEIAEADITVERYQLETCHVALSEGGMNGFMGTCLYRLAALSAAERRTFALLADFAFYAGTGRKTTMGLGQTVHLPRTQREERTP